MDSHVSHNGIARVIDEMMRLDHEIARLQHENRAQSEKTEGLRMSLKELAPAMATILAFQVVARAGGDPFQLKLYHDETLDFLPQNLENQESAWREDLVREFEKAIDTQTLHEPRIPRNWRELDVDVGPTPESQPEERKTKILFLAANPSETTHLRLAEEVREIDQALRRTEFRDRFDLEQHWAVRVGDLQELLQRHQPHMVHFSGHGSPAGEILLEDDAGHAHPISSRALSTTFGLLRDNIRVVVLNACYSEAQARAIAEHVDCVVGMSTAIGNRAAISFASAFYQALGFGRDVEKAFELGCAQIDLENLDEQDTPKLDAPRCDPSQVVLTEDPEA